MSSVRQTHVLVEARVEEGVPLCHGATFRSVKSAQQGRGAGCVFGCGKGNFKRIVGLAITAAVAAAMKVAFNSGIGSDSDVHLETKLICWIVCKHACFEISSRVGFR